MRHASFALVGGGVIDTVVVVLNVVDVARLASCLIAMSMGRAIMRSPMMIYLWENLGNVRLEVVAAYGLSVVLEHTIVGSIVVVRVRWRRCGRRK